MYGNQLWRNIPRYSMREVNSVVSEMWKKVGDEERRIYQEIAKENYEQRIERHNTSHRQS